MDQQAKAANEVADILGKQYMDALFEGIHTFYVDIDYLLDVRFTALLCLMTPDDYTIIKSNMEKYNTSYTKGVVEHFPGISITEEQIDSFLKNPDPLALTARMQYTTYFDIYLDFIKNEYIKNKLSSSNKEPIMITIGCKGLPIPKAHRIYVAEMVSSYLANGGKIVVIDGGLDTMSKTDMQKIFHFAVSDLEATLNNPVFSKHWESGLFNGRHFHVKPIVYTKETPMDPENPGKKLTPVEQLQKTCEVLNILFDFEYVQARIRYEG